MVLTVDRSRCHAEDEREKDESERFLVFERCQEYDECGCHVRAGKRASADGTLSLDELIQFQEESAFGFDSVQMFEDNPGSLRGEEQEHDEGDTVGEEEKEQEIQGILFTFEEVKGQSSDWDDDEEMSRIEEIHEFCEPGYEDFFDPDRGMDAEDRFVQVDCEIIRPEREDHRGDAVEFRPCRTQEDEGVKNPHEMKKPRRSFRVETEEFEDEDDDEGMDDRIAAPIRNVVVEWYDEESEQEGVSDDRKIHRMKNDIAVTSADWVCDVSKKAVVFQVTSERLEPDFLMIRMDKIIFVRGVLF
jgi:hypothetical protein